MKKTILLFCFIFVACVLSAKPIDKETAKQTAHSFLSKENSRKMRKAPSKDLSLSAVETTYERSFYVFNVGQDDGFVFVSANDQTESILGYVDEGSFDENSIPENMKAWLQFYQEEISNLGDTEEAQTESLDSKEAIEPLIATRWDQSSPYNYECHLGFIDSYALTGCAATAMAQVMNYHRWPQTTTKEIPAYTVNYINNNETTVKEWEAQPVYSFDWDNMKNTYTGSESTTDASAIAVAKLMRYCGQSVRMSYSNLGSSASTCSVLVALKDYFGYDADLTFVRRSSYTIQGWADLIYNELMNKRPVIYTGQSASGGHGFVCDGYDGNGLFHINWGWSGRYDGFFRLSVLNYKDANANASGEGYSMSQEAIIGIMPENNVTDTYASGDYTSGAVSFDVEIDGPDEVELGTENKYTIKARNTGDEYNGMLYVFVDSEKKSNVSVAIAAGDTEQAEISLAFTSEGSHVIKVTTDSNGSNVIAEKTVTVKMAGNVVNGLIADIKIDGLEEENGEYVYHGTELSIVYTFTNVTDEDYNGKLQMLYSYNGRTEGVERTGTIGARQTYSYTKRLGVYYGLTVTFQSNSFDPNTSECKFMKSVTVRFVEPTGIKEVKNKANHSDIYYNLKGMRIDYPTNPGLYIRNGKKIILK